MAKDFADFFVTQKAQISQKGHKDMFFRQKDIRTKYVPMSLCQKE